MGGPCTAAQARNIALCCQLQEVHRALLAQLPRLPPPASAALRWVCLMGVLLGATGGAWCKAILRVGGLPGQVDSSDGETLAC